MNDYYPKSSMPLIIILWGLILSVQWLELLWFIQPVEFSFLEIGLGLTNLSLPFFLLSCLATLLFFFDKWLHLIRLLLIFPLLTSFVSVYLVGKASSITLWLAIVSLNLVWLWVVIGLYIQFKNHRLLKFIWISISLVSMTYLYADTIYYHLTKAHIGIVHIWQLTFKSSWESINSIISTVKDALVIPLVFVVATAAILLFIKRKTGLIKAIKPVFWSVLVQTLVFCAIFDFVGEKLPLERCLMARYDYAGLPLPAPGILKQLDQVNDLALNLHIYSKDFFKSGRFSFLGKQRKNLLLIVLESVRAYQFEQNMPKLREIAKKGIYLKKHFTAGNMTKSAIFSFYNSSYPFGLIENYDILPESSFVEFLRRENYSLFRIFSKWGKIEGPMYNHFISIEVPKKTAEDNFEGAYPIEWLKYMKDDQVKIISRNAEMILKKTMDALAKPGPKFIDSYIFNSHFNYYFPDEYCKYKPVMPAQFSVYQLDPTPEIYEKLNNRYRNSLYYIDECLARFFEEFYKKGYDKNTVVVIFGDHGQSLGDAGFFGHSNGPHIYQFQVPCIILADGYEPQEYNQLSQHLDLVPTLGEIMNFSVSGVSGKNLFHELRTFTIEQEHSKLNRFIIRRPHFMSIYDLDSENRPQWLVSIGNEFDINERILELYSKKGIPYLQQKIIEDFQILEKEKDVGKEDSQNAK